MKHETPKLLCHLHLYPPSHNAGGELMVHAINTKLIDDYEWHVDVMTNRPPRRDDWHQDVHVRMIRDQRAQLAEYRTADVALTHLDATRQAMGCAARTKVPLVHVVHNHLQLSRHRVRRAALVVFNSEWVRREHAWDGAQMTLHPPVWLDDYEIDEVDMKRETVTLLNVSEAKGGELFWRLARAFPSTEFVGVRGGYGAQVEPPADLDNVTLINHTDNVLKVYARTRVLLMPSVYESWGRCAIEAAASSIPTIAGDTPGLRETGVPVEYLNADPGVVHPTMGAQDGEKQKPSQILAAWSSALRPLLDDDELLRVAGVAARVQAERVQQLSFVQLDEFEQRIRELANSCAP